MVNASSCTVKLWMHLRDVLGGLLSFAYSCMDVISVLNGNM